MSDIENSIEIFLSSQLGFRFFSGYDGYVVKSRLFFLVDSKLEMITGDVNALVKFIASGEGSESLRYISASMIAETIAYDTIDLIELAALSEACQTGSMVFGVEAVDEICNPDVRLDSGYVAADNSFWRIALNLGLKQINFKCIGLGVDLSDMTLPRLVFSQCNLYFLRLDNSHVDGLEVGGSEIGNTDSEAWPSAIDKIVISGFRTEFSADVSISHSNIKGVLDFRRAKLKNDLIKLGPELSVNGGEYFCQACANTVARLDFVEAKWIDIDHLIVQGGVSLSHASATGLKIKSPYIVGRLDLSGAAIEAAIEISGDDKEPSSGGRPTPVPAFIGTGAYISDVRAGRIDIRFIKLGGTLDLNRATVVGQIALSRVALDLALTMRGVTAKHVAITSLTSSHVDAGKATLGGAFEVEDSSIEILDVSSMSALSVTLNRQLRPNEIFPIFDRKELPSACTLPPVFQSEFPTNIDSLKIARNAVVKSINSSGVTNCIGAINFASSIIEGDFIIEGKILKAIDLNGARIGGKLVLKSDETRFSNTSCVNLRNTRADAVTFRFSERDTSENVSPSAEGNARRKQESDVAAFEGPEFIDTFGAEFRYLAPPTGASGAQFDEAKMANRLGVFKARDRLCSIDGSFNLANSSTDVYYGMFDAIALGYENIGDKQNARVVKVLKNREYAADANYFVRIIYSIADHVSGFGQNPVRAIGILLALIFVGPTLALLSSFLGRLNTNTWRSEIGYAFRRTFSFEGVAQALRWTVFSVDRSVPSLGLDSDFGSQKNMGLRGILAAWFYLQRILAFIVISLMLAGAFNMFQ